MYVEMLVHATARAFGILCGPTLMPILLAAMMARESRTPLAQSDLILFVLFLSILPGVLVVAAYRAGYLRDLDMSDRAQRYPIAIAGAALSAICTLALILHGAGAPLVVLAAGIFIQAAILGVLTRREKVSYHSAGIGGLAVAGWFIGGIGTGLPLSAIALATGWSRWYLGKHSLWQIVLGFGSNVALALWLGVAIERGLSFP